jgi:hypothetical protein
LKPIMEIYRVPRREVPVRILVDDGRTLEGALFTAESGANGYPEDVLHHLNHADEEFVPLLCGDESFLLNKAGIIWVQVTGDAAAEIVDGVGAGQAIPVRFSLAGGISVVGTLVIVMPVEKSRALDYLNASPKFVPLFGDDSATLVQRRFVVTVRTGERPEGA